MGRSRIVGKGTRLQLGIDHTMRKEGTPHPNGLLLRGVVIATYVTDDSSHPKFLDVNNKPLAVYCDVVAYPTIPKQRWFLFNQVLVTQKRGGLHDDNLWKPKATTTNIVTQILDETISASPGQLDGDHVLIGFMNDSFDEPIILKGLPHPSRDVGNELYPAGKRLKLKKIDGNPNFEKYQGVFSGVDGDGNHIVDSTFGHNGTLLPAGLEPPTDVTGTSGNQTKNLPKDAKHEVVFYDMTLPVTPVEVARFDCTKDAFEIILGLASTLTLKIEGSDLLAELTLGSGVKHVAISETLAALWGQLKIWLDAHTHPTGTGPSGISVPASPSWDATIESNKVSFPANTP